MHELCLCAPLIQASLSPRSMSRYLGLSGNQGRVTSWMKPGMALLARRYCQQGSLPKISLWINNPEGHSTLLCTRAMKGPRASFVGSHHVGMQVPEADHLAQHDPERRENSWWQGDGAAQMLGCTFPKVHRLHIHANSCYEDTEDTNLQCCIFCSPKDPVLSFEFKEGLAVSYLHHSQGGSLKIKAARDIS